MSATNLPNEAEAWDADFSYAYLERLYAALKTKFSPALIGDAADVLSTDKTTSKAVFVRHDIDVSLARALPLARSERGWAIATTYHVMLDSPFYDVRAGESRDALAELASLGHEIGLHYDVVARGMKETDSASREADVAKACVELEEIIGRRVRSLSFHLPVPELVSGPLHVAGRISAYGQELSQWYLSDSRARWREGDPLWSLERPIGTNLQILIHPIWWAEQHLHPTERLREFLSEVGPRLGRSYSELNDILWAHIIYRAADPSR
jgi:hypothetical protein